jgi:signal transduction histidine kinase
MYGFCNPVRFPAAKTATIGYVCFMRAGFVHWPGRKSAQRGLILIFATVATQTLCADRSSPGGDIPAVTNVSQIRQLASQNPNVSYTIQIEGDVWWASPAQNRFVLKDASGAEELEMNLPSGTPRAGQRVRVVGNGTIAANGGTYKLGTMGPVVDNNGVHAAVVKSGAIFLKAGLQPIEVQWFNGVEKYELEVDFEGPGVPRQKIPDTALFRGPGASTNTVADHPAGLNYRCFEVSGEVLPDFLPPIAVRSGVVSNFDLSVITRPEHIGLVFTGRLQIPQTGLYTFYVRSDDGSRLFVGEPSLRLEEIGRGEFPKPRELTTAQALDGQWIQVEGKVTLERRQSAGTQLELSTGGGRLRIEIGNDSGLPLAPLLGHRVRAAGFCQSAITTDGEKVSGILLVPTAQEIELVQLPEEVATNADADRGLLPVLKTAAEIHRLKREEAQRGYPVKIRGVVTSVLPEHQAFTMEDSTRGIYVVDSSNSRSDPPRIGEFLEVEGTTDPLFFAPIVNAKNVSGLGAGRLPDPVQPAWDQLMNGSLDAQFVEIQGIVTAVLPDGITLRTRGGIIRIELRLIGMKAEELSRYENALVRVRGCLLAFWDYTTHQVRVGEIKIYGADIIMDQPAPGDLFSSPGKTPSELLLFDPQAGEFERVKVSGQVVHVRTPEYFMMQGGTGLRFILKDPVRLQPGDQVDVVGFPELLDGGSPVLREAVVRRTGQAALPEAKRPPPDDLMHAGYDSTRVRVEGKLVSVRKTRTEQVLEMQSGVRTFVARLEGDDESVQALAVGSRLDLVGVYAGQGGNRAAGQDITSFELLLNSPADIRVLARPPWWTLPRLLIILGVLACVLAATVLWITQLHRQVEERTAELGHQIQERQRVEHQRAMEQERARIAQDLHDELGSGITEIGMLVARARSSVPPAERTQNHLEQVRDKAREMVTTLDEIVWAMNPRHDSLASLVSYLCLYADRFLGLANISWRLEGPTGPPDLVVDSRHRHQLFLAFKEALTNIVRHSGATEVRLSVQVEGGQICLSIADNGRGLAVGERTAGMDGVANMQSRLEKVGGRFEVAGGDERGTIVRFYLPAG